MRIIGIPVEDELTEVLLGARDIPAEAVRANLIDTLKDLKTILAAVPIEVNEGRVAHIDITLGVGLDGSVGLLGIGAKASASGALTIRISYDQAGRVGNAR